MIQLSERLKNVVDLVLPAETVADVGCDHGYVAIRLVQQKKAMSVIAMDVGKGPLSRAKEHIIQYGMEKQIETRLSDGVEALVCGEADCLICAGMGGKLVTGILERGLAVVRQMKALVLQPQSDISYVRAWLREHDFRIDAERMVCEDGKFYPMFRVIPEPVQEKAGCPEEMFGTEADKQCGQMTAIVRQRIEDRYGPLLLAEADPVLYCFLEKEHKIYAEILSGLEEVAQNAENIEARKAQLQEYLDDIETAKAYYYAERSQI